MFNSKNQFIFKTSLWALLGYYALKSLSMRIADSDLWWHLAAGRALFENRTFLRTDIFSHTMRGAEWINFEWLGEMIFYLCAKWGGLEALFGLKLVLAGAVIVLMALGLAKLGARGPGLLAAVLISFILLRPRLNERIELFTLLFLPAFVFLLSMTRNSPAVQARKVPWILFGIMIFWCNLHGGFVYGIGVVVLFLAGSYWSKESREYKSMLWWSLTLVLLGALINPYGPRLFLAHFEHLTQFQNGLHIIEEWAPPSLRAAPFFWGLFFVIAATVVSGLLAHRSEARFWIPSVIVFLVWAGLSRRNMALMVFTSIPFLVDIFSKWETCHNFRTDPRVHKGVFVAIAIVLATQVRLLARPIPEDKVQWNRFPKAACQFVREQNIEGVMYNTYHFGGYISWDLGPARPVFMDGRYLFHPILTQQSDMNNRAYETLSVDEWQRYWSDQKVDYAITNQGDFMTADGQLSSLDLQFPRSHWALVYWDDVSCVFVLRHSSLDLLANKFEYKVLRPFNWNDMTNRLNNKEIRKEDIKAELEKHKNRTGFTVTALEMEKHFHVE